MPEFDSQAFTERLYAVGLTEEELAEILDIDIRIVTRFTEGGTPGPANQVRLRSILASEASAQAALAHVRTRQTRDLRGEAAERHDLPAAPYGSGDIGRRDGGAAS
jgi:hypothetical protein